MDPRLATLQKLLELERLEVNIFRGDSHDIGSPQVYGGQVLGQALKAAYLTVPPERVAHSLHAYFLRRGDFNAPIVYFVDRSRDGHSFTSRRVTAIQHGEQIFTLSASFNQPEPGFDHQQVAPPAPTPESLADPSGTGSPFGAATAKRLSPRLREYFLRERPFEFRLVPASDPHAPTRMMWLRAVDRLPDDDLLHRCLLAYVSDFQLLGTALLPHEEEVGAGRLTIASIDHAMWFHRPLRIDDWLLYVTDSPSASGARGFARGSLYDRNGRLVASTAQEGLMRVVPPGAQG